MEAYVGQPVLVYAGVWLNKDVKGSYSTPIKGTIESFNGTVAKVRPNISTFKSKNLTVRDFNYEDVFDFEHYERDYWVNLNLYQTIRDPNEPVGGTITQEQFEDLRERMKLIEQKYSILSNHIHDKFMPETSIDKNDL